MAFTYGTTGLVTSWGSTGFNSLLVGTNQSPSKFSMTVVGDALDSTRFRSSSPYAAYKRVTRGLRSISGSFTSYVSTTPRTGCTGLVTNLFATTTGTTYDAFINAYNINIKAAMQDTTLFNATCPEWRSFTAGLVEWGGSASGFLDDATYLAGPAQDNQPTTSSANFATFQISSTKSLKGALITTNVSTDVDPRNIIPVKFDFVGDDYLNTTGAAAELWGAGDYTITTPIAETLTLQTDTGNTYSGSAFWTSIDIKCKVDELLEITVNWQGTGAWTGFTQV